jgi:hypothetical protein
MAHQVKYAVSVDNGRTVAYRIRGGGNILPVDEILRYIYNAVAGVEIPFSFIIQHTGVGDGAVILLGFSGEIHTSGKIHSPGTVGDGERIAVGLFEAVVFCHNGHLIQ